MESEVVLKSCQCTYYVAIFLLVSASLWRLRATPTVVVPHRRASTRQFAGQTTSATSLRVTPAVNRGSMGWALGTRYAVLSNVAK